MPKVTAICWTEIIFDFESHASGDFQSLVLEFCVRNHLMLPGKIYIRSAAVIVTSVPSRSLIISDPFFCTLGQSMGLMAVILLSSRHRGKIYFPFFALLTGPGFLKIYDRGSICDYLGSKNCKFLCGWQTFIPDHVPVSIFLYMPVWIQVKTGWGSLKRPVWAPQREVQASLTVNPFLIAFKSVCVCARVFYLAAEQKYCSHIAMLTGVIPRSRAGFPGG